MGKFDNRIPRTAAEFLVDRPDYAYIPLEYIQGGIDRFEQFIDDAGWEERDMYDGDEEGQTNGVHRHIAIDVFVHMPDSTPEEIAEKDKLLTKLIETSSYDDIGSGTFDLEDIKHEADEWIRKNVELSARNLKILDVLQSAKASINSLIQHIEDRDLDGLEKRLKEIQRELDSLKKGKK